MRSPESKRDREGLLHAVIEVLGHGYALTLRDLGKMATYYGYKASTIENNFFTTESVVEELADKGFRLGHEYHYNKSIYFDGDLKPEQTDIARTREIIDIERHRRLHELDQRREATNDQPTVDDTELASTDHTAA